MTRTVGRPAAKLGPRFDLRPIPPAPTTWVWDPHAPLWPWVQEFFTLDVLASYDGYFPDACARLCAVVGRELKHQIAMGRL